MKKFINFSAFVILTIMTGYSVYLFQDQVVHGNTSDWEGYWKGTFMMATIGLDIYWLIRIEK